MCVVMLPRGHYFYWIRNLSFYDWIACYRKRERKFDATFKNLPENIVCFLLVYLSVGASVKKAWPFLDCEVSWDSSLYPKCTHFAYFSGRGFFVYTLARA